jgi:hypothetical protein
MWRWAGREPVSFRLLTSITAHSAVELSGGGVLLTGYTVPVSSQRIVHALSNGRIIRGQLPAKKSVHLN